MKNPKLIMTVLAQVILISLCSCSSEPKDQNKPDESANTAPGRMMDTAPVRTVDADKIQTVDKDPGRGVAVLNAVTATATVQSVDVPSRTLVLQEEDGSELSYVCGPDVRNFDRIEVGDKVRVTLAEQMAVVLVKGEALPATGRTTVLVRSEPGAKPGGKIVDTVAITARVMAVDAEERAVTLHLPDGRDKKVAVGPDVHLENVNVGDYVGVQLTQAIIITVKKP